MAEENPKFEINTQHKKINNPRETFLAENENLIIGKKGLTFQYYPTKKEKLKYYLNRRKNQNPFYKTFSNNKNIFNYSINYNITKSNSNKNLLNNRHINQNNFMNNIQTLPKSISQTNFFKNPKNESNINNYAIIESNKNNIENLINKYNINKNKFFSPITRPKIQKIKYPKLSKLQNTKNKAKKKKEKKRQKTHFKGLESIYIHPKEIYDLFKKEDAIRLEKMGYFNIDEKKVKEQELIEKRNEYKSDIKELIKEEQDFRDIINTKEFSEYLGNNKFFREAEYNDRSNYSDFDEDSNNIFISENDDEKMEYLKKIAFEDKKVEKTHRNPISYFNAPKKVGKNNKKDIDSDDESFFEEMKKSKKRDNINILLEMEDQLRVEGKVYHMKKQMDKICKELLNKYKIHKVLKKIKK